MGIYIKGMKMPIQINDESVVAINDITMTLNSSGEAELHLIHGVNEDGTLSYDSYPLIEVPPHGRLVDADKIMDHIRDYIEEYGWWTDEHGYHSEKWCAMKEAEMVIEEAPTILEGDGDADGQAEENL